MARKLLFSLIGVLLVSSATIARDRLPDRRLAAAKRRCVPILSARSRQIGIPFPPSHVYFCAYKQEGQLEVWVEKARRQPYVLFRTYPIAAMSGALGPKRREGDSQVPEGVYHVVAYNPSSRFHLSLRLNYPNSSDRVRSDRDHPGSDIYIHGNRVSIGCMAMTDEKIEEIYLLALYGKAAGVPVYVFPCHMEGSAFETLKYKCHGLELFWSELEPIYNSLAAHHRPVRITVDRQGVYILRNS